ncbi:MAG: hypothetical protein FJ217_16685, partial [Ignavibacteria bacterium]|nr:hypothetical protein [Ignavibacteria bacterium]
MNARPASLLLVLILAACHSARAQLWVRETENVRLLYYTKEHEYLVEHAARCFENGMQFHRSIFNYTPSEKVTLLLQDFGDFASGGANTVPFNLASIGIAPFSYVYETMPPVERMTMMANHEFAHIAMMDKSSPSNRFFRSLFFGKVAPINEAPLSMLYAYLTSPRWNSPRWYIEGSAVFMETWMNGGLGRALGAYDEMVFRTKERDGSYFYDVIGLEAEGTKEDFQVGANSYLYGTRFVSYLGLQYGPQKLLNWFAQNDSSANSFSRQFERVYGTPLDEEWSRWIDWEKRWQKANLDSVRTNPVTTFRVIGSEGLGSVSRGYYDSTAGRLYTAINYPGQTAHIAAIDIQNGKIEKLQDVRGAALFYVTSLAYDQANQTLFYTTDNNRERDLYALDLRSGASQMLMKNFRTGDLAFNRADRSLWGVRHFAGISTIVRIPHPYREWYRIYSWDYGKDVFDLDVSPDGRLLTAALAELSGRQLLIAMNIDSLMEKKFSYWVLSDFDFDPSTPANFIFSPDGRYLYGSSYYTGVSNIVRYDFQKNEMNWLTNAESGLFRPVPISDDSLIAFHYTGKGFVPVMIENKPVYDVKAIRYLGNDVVQKYPELERWQTPPPSRIKLDSLTLYAGTYRPISGFRLASLYPIVEGYKEFPSYGVRLNFSDPLMLNRLDFAASYSPNTLIPASERFHASVNFKSWKWTLSGKYNAADFYDLFGPTKLSRAGYALTLGYRDYLVFDEPETMSWEARASGYWNLKRLPEYQNIGVRYDKFYSTNFALEYRNLVKSLGAVEDEKGLEAHFGWPTNFIQGTVFPRVYASASYGTLLPIHHS